VLREVDGRGGSAYLNDDLRADDVITVRGPRNNFRLEVGRAVTFIAAGIGITPLLSMMRELERGSIPWRLHYLGRETDRMAYLEALRGDPRVTVHITGETGRPDLAALLADDPDSVVYACGSAGFLLDLERVCAATGRTLHVEWFAPRPDAPRNAAALDAFEVVLDRSGITVDVVPGQSIIDAADAAGVTIPGSCFEGTCGSCETAVLDGIPDHRDSVLSPGERAENLRMLPCVSRSCSVRLVLDA